MTFTSVCVCVCAHVFGRRVSLCILKSSMSASYPAWVCVLCASPVAEEHLSALSFCLNLPLPFF